MGREYWMFCESQSKSSWQKWRGLSWICWGGLSNICSYVQLLGSFFSLNCFSKTWRQFLPLLIVIQSASQIKQRIGKKVRWQILGYIREEIPHFWPKSSSNTYYFHHTPLFYYYNEKYMDVIVCSLDPFSGVMHLSSYFPHYFMWQRTWICSMTG